MKSPQAQPVPRLSTVRLFVPFLFWLVVIFALSAYPKAIIPQSKYVSWDKLAHVVEFGILGYLTARTAFFSGHRWISLRFVQVAIFFGVFYAASDEWHQLHVPGRWASPLDILADSIGVVVGLLIFLQVTRSLRSRMAYKNIRLYNS